MKELKKDTRVVLFFSWATGEGDYIDLPSGLLKDVVKVLERYNQYFIPIVQVDKEKFYYCIRTGELRPI